MLHGQELLLQRCTFSLSQIKESLQHPERLCKYSKALGCEGSRENMDARRSRAHSPLVGEQYLQQSGDEMLQLWERGTVAAASTAACSFSAAGAFLVLRAVLAGCAAPVWAPCAAVPGAFCTPSDGQHITL